MAEETYKGDVLQKVAGLAFIVGAILTGVLNALFPRADDPSVVTDVLEALADDETFARVAFLGLAIGFWALMIGVAGVYRSISTGGAAVWARLGFYGVIVGTTLVTMSLAVGVGTTEPAADWVAAGSRIGTSEYNIAATLNAIGESIFFMAIIVYWLALAFVGIGMVLSKVYPQWLNWPPLVLGAAMAVVGVPTTLNGFDDTTELIFSVLAGLTTLWALAMGVWITRREIKAM